MATDTSTPQQAIDPDMQAIADIINGCPNQYLLKGLPRRSWLKTNCPGLLEHHTRTIRKAHPMRQYAADTRLFSHRLWAWLLFAGKVQQIGEGTYDAEYQRAYPRPYGAVAQGSGAAVAIHQPQIGAATTDQTKANTTPAATDDDEDVNMEDAEDFHDTMSSKQKSRKRALVEDDGSDDDSSMPAKRSKTRDKGKGRATEATHPIQATAVVISDEEDEDEDEDDEDEDEDDEDEDDQYIPDPVLPLAKPLPQTQQTADYGDDLDDDMFNNHDGFHAQDPTQQGRSSLLTPPSTAHKSHTRANARNAAQMSKNTFLISENANITEVNCMEQLALHCTDVHRNCSTPGCTTTTCMSCAAVQADHLKPASKAVVRTGAFMPMCIACQHTFTTAKRFQSGNCNCALSTTDPYCLPCLEIKAEGLAIKKQNYIDSHFGGTLNYGGHSRWQVKCMCGRSIEGNNDGMRRCVGCNTNVRKPFEMQKEGVIYTAGLEPFHRDY